MTLRRLALAALVLIALLAPSALASGEVPPDDAPRIALGERTLAYPPFASPAQAGTDARLHFAVTKGNLTNNVTVTIVVDSEGLALANRTVTIVMPAEPVALSDVWRSGELPFYVPLNATGNVTYTFHATVASDGPNGTVILANAAGSGVLEIQAVQVPVPPGAPFPWLLVGAIALAVAGGGTVVVLRQRALKRRMNEAPRRSTVMRDLELEQKLERTKDPEHAKEIKQEIRAQEVVREKRRELQILEAKRADALKTLDLLRKRHETGGLTKYQFDAMSAKKQADLAKIEADIAEMERADGGAAA